VKNLGKAVATYRKLGFEPVGPPEILRVRKIVDSAGQMIELIEGNYHPHIAVNWLEDEDGNWIELVEVR
jgi:hypothetical protein